MTELTLKDKGFYDVSQTKGGTTDEQAYGSDGAEGTTLNLHAVRIKLIDQANLNKEAALGKLKSDTETLRYEYTEIDKTSVLNPTWEVKGSFNVEDEDHMKDYGRLRHMVKTKGYKELGFDSAETKVKANILKYAHYGQREFDGEGTLTVSTINVRIEKAEFEQDIKKGFKISYTLNLVETN